MTRIHLSNRTKVWINCVGIGVWASGGGWLVVHYFIQPTGASGLENDSWGPWWLKVHGAFAFLAVWCGGLLWGLHVIRAWKTRRHRWSGGTLFAVLLVLIVSGYLLYYVGDDRLRDLISRVHWVLGLVIPLAYLIHRITKLIFRRYSGSRGNF
jgi:hypothetical protein